jgi:hypothetical protein
MEDARMVARDSTMDRIVWKAYTEPKFFRALMENKGSITALRTVLQSHGLTAVPPASLRALKRSLNHRRVHASPEELMTALHKCTKPALLKQDNWVQW